MHKRFYVNHVFLKKIRTCIFSYLEKTVIFGHGFCLHVIAPHLAIEHTGLYRYDSYYLKYILKYQDDGVDT